MNILKYLSITLIALSLAACSEEEDNDLGNMTPDDTTELAGQVAPLTETGTSADATGGQLLNLNTATEEQFLTVPNVGENMAHEFEEYRPYASILQFRKAIAKYTDEASITAYEQYVFVPVDPNESDAATIAQIPGIDETEAAEIIAGRPYENNAAFLEKLAPYMDGDASAASNYLTAE